MQGGQDSWRSFRKDGGEPKRRTMRVMRSLLDRVQNAIRRGFRNRNWKKLKNEEKQWIRCVRDYLRTGQKIVSLRILSPLMELIKDLTSTVKRDIMEEGLNVAKKIMNGWDGVFEWCPQMKEWLWDEDYIFYLGVSSMNSNGCGFP